MAHRKPTFFFQDDAVLDDPAVAAVQRHASELSLAEDDDAPPGIGGACDPPGLSAAQPAQEGPRWLLPHRPFADVDALSQGVLGAGRGATLVTFPGTEDAPAHLSDRAGAMSRWEREGVSRTHLAQLTTATPEVEDCYYRARVRRLKAAAAAAAGGRAHLGAGTVPGFFLPMPTPSSFPRAMRRADAPDSAPSAATANGSGSVTMEGDATATVGDSKNKESDEAEELRRVLGRSGRSTARRPRAALTLDGEQSVASTASLASLVAGEDAWHAVAACEEAFDADLPLREAERSAFLARRDELRAAMVALVGNALVVAPDTPTATAKGARNVARALRLLRPGEDAPVVASWLAATTRAVLADGIVALTSMDERRERALVHGLLAAFVPHVSALAPADVATAARMLVSPRAGHALARSRALVVLACVLFSRLQIARVESEASPDDAAVSFFDAIAPNFADIMAAHDGGGDATFYAWQLMALLALLVDDAERKRALVLGLRDAIIAAVNSSDEALVSNVDILLHALGLDSSQLRE